VAKPTETKQERRTLRDFFIELLRSFRPATYPALVRRGASAAGLYLGGVAVLATLALAPALYILHAHALTREQAYFERALPESLTFEGGAASYDGERPHMYVEREGGRRAVVIVDTTGQTTAIGDEFEYGMLITATAIIHKVPIGGGRSEMHEEPIPATEGRMSARQFFADLLERQRWPGFIMLVGQQFVVIALVVFVLAGLTAVVAYGLGLPQREGRLAFSTCFSATAHAATPLMITTACLPAVLATTRSPVQFYLAFGVPLVLFVLLAARGIQACRSVEEAHPEKVRKAR
jgi:hypothetical protein